MMKPRLRSSKKKTEFPADYVKMIKAVINKNFAQGLKGKTLIVEGVIYTEEILVRVGYREAKLLTQRNFEASVTYSLKAKNIMDQIYLAIDAIGAMMDQFFKAQTGSNEKEQSDLNEGLELPKIWTEFKFDTKSVWLQVSAENSDLEAQANDILKKAGIDPAELEAELDDALFNDGLSEEGPVGGETSDLDDNEPAKQSKVTKIKKKKAPGTGH